jgi:AraC-like DNA-binding protein
MSTLKVRNPRCRLAEMGLGMDGSLRMAALLGLPQFLADHGLDPDVEIRRTGCDPTLFQNPENIIEFAAVGRLLDHMATVTGCPCPGFELTRHLGLEVFGVLGEVMRLAPDPGTALNTLIRAFHLHDRGAIPFLLTVAGKATFGYTIYCPDIPGVNQIYDGALAICQNILTELAGPDWKASEVRFVRGTPGDIGPYRRHFHTKLLFGAEQAAIVFSPDYLVRPIAGANPAAYAKALKELEHMDEASGSFLASKVLRVLRRQFISSAGPDGIDLQKVAWIFTMHPRTLNRRLRAEGTTFAALLAEARYEIARQLLRDTELQISDISYLLGYAHSASFNKAFRRWSGMTTTLWRASHTID